MSILENTVDNAQRREAILDEALASTDKTLETVNLLKPKDDLEGPDGSLPMKEGSREAAQEVLNEKKAADT